jgi:hypothetical protein
MDTHSDNPDELSGVEERLAHWRPGSGGLDADAMLFAAGLAAGRRGRHRFVAPALCGLMAVAAVSLGAWGMRERAERLALAGRLDQLTASAGPGQAPAVAALAEPSYTPSPDDYFHLRRHIEQDPNRWLASAEAVGVPAPERTSPATIPRAGEREGLLRQ